MPEVGRRVERGASAVEFAIVLPLLVLFLFGIIEYGVIFFVNNDVTEAVSDTTRSALSDYAAGDDSSQITQAAVAYLATALDKDSSGMIPGTGTSGCATGLTTNVTPTGSSVTTYTNTTGSAATTSASSVTLPSPTSSYPVICEATINQPGTGGCTAATGYECLVVVAEYGWSTKPVIALPLIPTPSTLTASSSILITSTES